MMLLKSGATVLWLIWKFKGRGGGRREIAPSPSSASRLRAWKRFEKPGPARILGRGRVVEVGKNSPSIRRIFWSFCFCVKYAPISGVFSIPKF